MYLLSKNLEKWEEKLREYHHDYAELAKTDPQKSGHSAERIWLKLIKEMLPPSYRVLSRSYMETETDLVVLPPSAPSFYDDAEVIDIPPTIATAVIHVKNTLDRARLKDDMERIQKINEDLPKYHTHKERELEGLPCAVVGLGSTWSGGFTSARTAFMELIGEIGIVSHPGQIPGYVGTPEWDIRCHSFVIPKLPHTAQKLSYQTEGSAFNNKHVAKCVSGDSSGKPIHNFVEWLYTACAASDRTIEPMRVALSQMFEIGGGSQPIPFELNNVFSAGRTDI